jgi:hypothetical protein
MKKVIVTFIAIVLGFASANAQAPAFSATTSQDVVVIAKPSDDGKTFYTYGMDTSLLEGTVKNLQFYLDGEITITEVASMKNEKVAVRGKLVKLITSSNVRYYSGTMGKVMSVSTKVDSLFEEILKSDGAGKLVHDSMFAGIKKHPRVLLVSFSSKDGDVWVPFSPGDGVVSADEQFTTSHVVANQQPLYTYEFNKKLYQISGTGTLKIVDKNSSHIKNKIGRGRRYNQ